jgi:hypothetical protein
MVEETNVGNLEVQNTIKNVRIELKQNAKGFVQFEFSVHYDTVEEAIENLEKAIIMTKEVIARNNLKEAT